MKNRVKEFRELQDLKKHLSDTQGKRLEQVESNSRIAFIAFIGLGIATIILVLTKLFS